ncbi:DUF4136 domain-containing protein [Pontibacter sp. KCTC 32443]|uniref:DUF4136 domain-containing protein n=1 Tax=Pontibacter TaxID=323449 RepID=UPI00164D1113|nr:MULTISPECIES: DUF4136 domain-containing protein [Pontibacter]MBC5773514.1 DUF4136 domain-containing protein [Pontibacter sp. KCTC 32443]
MKKHTLLFFLYFPTLCFIAFSCVTSNVASRPNAVAATGANTAKLRTYAWLQDQPVAPVAYDKDYNATLNQHLRKAIEEELQQKGFTKATSGKPDVLLAYDVSVSVPVEKDNPANFSDGFGYSYAYMSGYRYSYGHATLPGYRAVDLYRSGTLIIDFVNPATNELMWRGWSEGAISNFKANYGTVHGEVEKVLETLTKR